MKKITKKEFINALSTKKNLLVYCSRQLKTPLSELLEIIGSMDNSKIMEYGKFDFRTVKKVQTNSIEFSDDSCYMVKTGCLYYNVNGCFVEIEKVKNFEGKEVINLLGYILID